MGGLLVMGGLFFSGARLYRLEEFLASGCRTRTERRKVSSGGGGTGVGTDLKTMDN